MKSAASERSQRLIRIDQRVGGIEDISFQSALAQIKKSVRPRRRSTVFLFGLSRIRQATPSRGAKFDHEVG